MKTALAFFIAITGALPLCAQDAHTPIIPNLIGLDTKETRIAVKIDRGLTSTKRLSSAELRRARTALHEGGIVSADNLRALANAGDGLAAQRYVRVLQASNAAPNASDVAFFSAIAVGSGRIWTLGTMIDAMYQLDPKVEPSDRVSRYIRVLYPHAWAGNPVALKAVVAFNGDGRLFGPLSDATRDRILAEARAHGDGRLELGIAMGLLETIRATKTPEASDLAQARDFLKLAKASKHLGVSTTAQNLLTLMDQDRTKDG